MKIIDKYSILDSVTYTPGNVYKVKILYADQSGVICKVNKNDTIRFKGFIDNEYVDIECEAVEYKANSLYIKYEEKVYQIADKYITYIYNISHPGYNYVIEGGDVLFPPSTLPPLGDITNIGKGIPLGILTSKGFNIRSLLSGYGISLEVSQSQKEVIISVKSRNERFTDEELKSVCDLIKF